jgi:hypothetical protein
MLRFGVVDREGYRRLGPERREAGAHVALTLLDSGDDASDATVEDFEHLCFVLRLSNGTFRTSFRNRFPDVNSRLGAILEGEFDRHDVLRIEDRAASHGLTAKEWASEILAAFPNATFEASDLILDLKALVSPDGVTYVAEPDGTPIQVIAEPFVVPLCHRGPLRYPINSLVSWWYRRRWRLLALPPDWPMREAVGDLRVKSIPFLHPEVRTFLNSEPRFHMVCRSAFEVSPIPCQAIRTMNIFNRAYFTEEELQEACKAVFRSMALGGYWVLGRTTERDFQNHVSILRRRDRGWEVLDRIGHGSEIEQLALAFKGH